jgi:hypothetical protein
MSDMAILIQQGTTNNTNLLCPVESDALHIVPSAHDVNGFFYTFYFLSSLNLAQLT